MGTLTNHATAARSCALGRILQRGLPLLAVLAAAAGPAPAQAALSSDPNAAAGPPASRPEDPNCPNAVAGRPLEIRSGACFRSTIDEGDPKDEENLPYEDWRLRLAAGDVVQIDMDALGAPLPATARSAVADDADETHDGFDTYLELRRPGPGEILEANDDRPRSLNSTILFTATEPGDYIVRARPLFRGRGDSTLRVSVPTPPPPPVSLALGANPVAPPDAQGNMIQERVFTFQGNAGDRVRLRMPRGDNGDWLELEAPNEGGTIEMTQGSDEELEIATILPATGTYRVVARILRTPNPVATSLHFARTAPGPARAPVRIRVGQTIDGEIGTNSPAGEAPWGGFQLHELFELRMRRGEVVTVTLESSDFDPVIDAGTMSALGFAGARSDDDGGGGRNSRLVLRPERSGMVTLRVRPLGNRMGAFRLRVVDGDVAVSAEPVTSERPPRP